MLRPIGLVTSWAANSQRTKVLQRHTFVCYCRSMKKPSLTTQPPSREPLERTSAQLSRQTLDLLDSWPGLNRSEVLRLTLDRYHYLEDLSTARAESLVEKYRPVFHVALAELSFTDYKVVARSLPAIVMGAMGEESLREAVERDRQMADAPEIDWKQFQDEISALDPLARIRALDYVTGQRLTEQA